MTEPQPEQDPYATAEDVGKAWRPLTPTESERAEYLIGMAVRQLRRRWKDLDARVTSGTVDREDLRDVIVWMVVPVLGGPPTPGAKSWRVSAGTQSQQVDMGTGNPNPDRLMVIAPWMVEIFEDPEDVARQTALPAGDFPPAGRFEAMGWEWSEKGRTR